MEREPVGVLKLPQEADGGADGHNHRKTQSEAKLKPGGGEPLAQAAPGRLPGHLAEKGVVLGVEGFPAQEQQGVEYAAVEDAQAALGEIVPLQHGPEAEKERLFALGSAAPVLWSANYSLGVAVLARALQVIAPVLGPDFDIEIAETHHGQKADAPSGTAKLLLEAIDPQHRLRPVYGREGNCGRREKDEVGIHALRGGTVAGTHTVHFFGPDEELELTHRAASRRIFVNGALHMAHLLPGRPNGVYDLQKILFGE